MATKKLRVSTLTSRTYCHGFSTLPKIPCFAGDDESIENFIEPGLEGEKNSHDVGGMKCNTFFLSH